MELMAVCVALEALKFDGSDVTVYSDSKYVVDAVTKGWVFGWVKKQFAGKKNPDLWMRFLRVYRHHNVRFVWVKGHADTVENNRCDQLAVAAETQEPHVYFKHYGRIICRLCDNRDKDRNNNVKF